MTTVNDIMAELATMGSESTKKVLMKHGAREPFFGVKVEDLKKIVKRVKTNHDLALGLFETGNSDAMYLAGLIADEKAVTKAELNHWLDGAYWYMISEFTVPWLAAESPHGWDLALSWINSDEERFAAAGWATLSNLVTLTPDEKLDLPLIESLLQRVARDIHQSPNRVRYTMNGFVIHCAIQVVPMTEKALSVAARYGKVMVDMGGTACKVPDAATYVANAKEKGRMGKKKKQVRC